MNAPLRFHPPAQGSSLARRLRSAVQGEVLFDRAARGRYSTDASIYQVEPVGVLIPKTHDDVRVAVEVSRDLRVPLLPRGGGSSQCGQTVGAALVIDHSKYLNNVLAFDPQARTVTVEPGIVLDALNAWLKPHGLWFPVDVSTSAQATLGGMAGNNSCGSRSIAYGNMVHNVLAIDALLADGTEARFAREAEMTKSARVRELVDTVRSIAAEERDEIERRVPKVMRRVGGYNIDIFHPQSERLYTADGSANLAHLLVGSEGTLAWTRALTLQLAPLPAQRTLGVVSFPTLYRAMQCAQHIVTLTPSAVELVDRTMIELARGNPAFKPVIEAALVGDPDAILLVEFSDEMSEQNSLRQLDRLVTLIADLGLPDQVVRITDTNAQKALWEVRKAGLNIMMSMRGDGKPVSFIEDCAVPLQHLADYVARLTEVFTKHGTRGTWYAHASVGTLHVRPILNMRTDGAAKMRVIAEEASAIVREYKGAYSGEHGDGLVRSEWVAWQFGPRLTRAFGEIKALFDPDNLMNPGKIVRPSRMDDARLFRYPPGYRIESLQTALDWSAWDVQNDPATETLSAPGTGGDPAHGFGKAVEMCNNNGHCRKFDAGTMCPSFRVTRDEEHLTRGRANTLRLALSGQLPGGLTSDAVRDALDLCVSCKGCRRECPTGVDMARMKIEFLHHYHRERRLSVKDRLIAYLPHYAHWGARLPWLFNARNTLPGAAALSEKWFGFAAQRSLPSWRSDTFLGGLQFSIKADGTTAPQCEGPAGEVVLFADTFSNAFEPEIGHDAIAVLEAAGYTVHVALPNDGSRRPLCCGRTFLATGLVDQAKAEARRTLDALLPHVQRGATIVGLEPSCLLSMRDEFLVMGLGDAAQHVAPRALLIEEFLARERRAGKLRLRLERLPQKRALVHGHCHQKAFDALTPTIEVLKAIPELEVDVIDSSCCGMAGAFGYEAAHHDVSMKMAELSLLPAVRGAGPDTLIVADGTSCRHQIADGTTGTGRREALHAIRVLANAVRSAR